MYLISFFVFNDTATTEIYTLSLHDALPICFAGPVGGSAGWGGVESAPWDNPSQLRLQLLLQLVEEAPVGALADDALRIRRSEEHTSELQSRQYLVCRLLLEKKKKTK